MCLSHPHHLPWTPLKFFSSGPSASLQTSPSLPALQDIIITITLCIVMTIFCFTRTNYLQLLLKARKKIFFSLVLSIYLRSVSYKTVSIIYAQCLLEASDQGSRSRPSLIHNFEAHYLPLVMRSEFHFY